MFRIVLPIAAALLGLVVGARFPETSRFIDFIVPPSSGKAAQGDSHGHGRDGGNEEHGEHEGPEGSIKLSAAQISAARIETAPASGGTLHVVLTAPATVAPDPDRIARVPAKVVGTVTEMRKRLGDEVKKGEVIAVIDSREVAEAKNDYLAALVTHGLQSELFQRERMLFERQVSAEQQFLRAKSAFSESQLRLDLARQKLAALDLTEPEIAALSKQPLGALKRKEIRAPASGRIVERRVDLGTPVGGEGQEKELYVIADLSTVWADLSVPVADLAPVREGQKVRARNGGETIEGEIIFISPTLHPETRSARVIAAMPNPNQSLRSGALLTAQITIEEIPVDIRVPRAAVQNISGQQVVFVRNDDGFEKREVVLGKGDAEWVEVVFGLDPGEEFASANTFTLKADLGKAEAEHSH